jgi:hypothetical protein
MKAALEAWGAGSNLFHQGVAKETDPPEVVAATMSKPGVVLKRPAGLNGEFAEHSDLPSDLGSGENGARRERRRAKPATRAAPKTAPELSEREALPGANTSTLTRQTRSLPAMARRASLAWARSSRLRMCAERDICLKPSGR